MKSLFCLIMITTWIFVIAGCTPRLDSNGCYGYWYDPGLKRGTIQGKNATYVSPYRQCVDKDNIILIKEKRPYG